MKKSVFTTAIVMVCFVAAAAFAGSLDAPAGGPTNAASQSYTLDAIWNRLNDGTDGAQSTFTEPGATPPAATGHTINDVMTKAPVKDDTNGAVPADVLTGKKFWGLTSGAWGLKTGTAASMPTEAVRKSGQTTLYLAGDDGDLEKGVALPIPRFTPSNGTVTDNLTGLVWLQNANCIATINGIDPTATANKLTWQNAVDWSAGLASGTCGLADGSTAGQWRLPTVKELHSLIHFGYSNPALSNDAGDAIWGTGTSSFTGVQTSRYWSATTYTVNTANAWYVHLFDGFVNPGAKTVTYYVWPVR
jgi:hypothetical protein